MSLSKEYVSDSDSDEEVLYQPPKGYQKLKNLPNFTNIEGKEIWLIKAPKKFEFKSLKNLPISFNPLEASSKFVNNDKKYTIKEDLTSSDLSNNSTSSKYSLIISKDSSAKFNDKLKIKRFYNVIEDVKIPAIDYSKVTTLRKDVPVVRGLKPQHFATGYDKTDEDVTSDVELEEPSTKKVKLEKHLGEGKKEKKEKKENREKKDKVEKREKKDKKKKTKVEEQK